jgi:hypothetical protein
MIASIGTIRAISCKLPIFIASGVVICFCVNLNSFCELIITDELATFLNHLPNAEELGKEMITTAETDVTLTDALMKSDKITDVAFEHLVQSISSISEAPDFGEIKAMQKF